MAKGAKAKGKEAAIRPAKHAGGRPTEYTLERVREEARLFLEWVRENPGALFLAEFIDTRDYSPQRWSEWWKRFRNDGEFSEAVKKGESILEMRLIAEGMAARNPAMVIFLLANKYGYSRNDRNAPPPDQETHGEIHVKVINRGTA